MGVEPTTLRDLVRCSNHWATGDLMVSKGARFYWQKDLIGPIIKMTWTAVTVTASLSSLISSRQSPLFNLTNLPYAFIKI